MRKGSKHSEETRRKISEACKGENSPHWGKHLSDETKKKISDSEKGRKCSEETRKKISDGNKGKYVSEETRRKLSEVHRGKHHSDETKKKISKAIWKGGKVHNRGYILILNPNHPFSDKRGYVLEHRLIMEKFLDRYLTPEEVVHHENGVRDDNRIENLKLFKNIAEHIRYHKEMRLSAH